MLLQYGRVGSFFCPPFIKGFVGRKDCSPYMIFEIIYLKNYSIGKSQIDATTDF